MSPDKKLVEVMERDDHPWFIGVQFHPELNLLTLNRIQYLILLLGH